MELFERSTRSVRLTPAGAALLPRVRQALSVLDDVEAHARLIGDGSEGAVRIGFTTGASYRFVPQLVAAVTAALPAIELTLLEMATSDQVEALAAGQLDLAVIRPLESRGSLRVVCVAREPLRLALPHNHHLSRLTRPIEAADLADEPFLAYSAAENPYFHGLVATAMHRAQFTPACIQHVRAIHTMLSLVGAGIGLDSDRARRIAPVYRAGRRAAAARSALRVDRRPACRLAIRPAQPGGTSYHVRRPSQGRRSVQLGALWSPVVWCRARLPHARPGWPAGPRNRDRRRETDKPRHFPVNAGPIFERECQLCASQTFRYLPRMCSESGHGRVAAGGGHHQPGRRSAATTFATASVIQVGAPRITEPPTHLRSVGWRAPSFAPPCADMTAVRLMRCQSATV